MSKNFIDMSFDEIFPEQKPLQNKTDNMNADLSDNTDHYQIEYEQDEYDTSDRYASQPEYPPPPAAVPQNYGTMPPAPQNIPSAPPIPEFTDFNPDSYQYNNMNSGNAPTTLPKIRNIVTPPTTAAYNNTNASKPNPADSAKGVQLAALGIIGIFMVTLPPIGTIISIAGIINTIKYNIQQKKTSNAVKSSTVKAGQVLCIISLILNMLLLIAMLIHD
ncbi:MAG: hypothetical protein IJ192_05820 [Clostridia bacterium]|nr:hypothetical protein [Clostridia bacterium]